MTRFLLLAGALALAASSASAQSYHRGYVTRNGTYVAPHWQSSPNNTTTDNWSVRPNVNPYTGQPGTREPSFGLSPSPQVRPNSGGLPSPYGTDALGDAFRLR